MSTAAKPMGVVPTDGVVSRVTTPADGTDCCMPSGLPAPGRPASVTESLEIAITSARSRSLKFWASGRTIAFDVEMSSPEAENVWSRNTTRMVSMSTIEVRFSSA